MMILKIQPFFDKEERPKIKIKLTTADKLLEIWLDHIYITLNGKIPGQAGELP